jgi:hypothetical protein
MSYGLNETLVNIIEEAAGNYDGEITEYSGRSMYGKTCLGITLDDFRKIAEMLVYIAGDDHDLATMLANGLTLDSMGRSMIAYWPTILFDGFTDSDSDDDDN